MCCQPRAETAVEYFHFLFPSSGNVVHKLIQFTRINIVQAKAYPSTLQVLQYLGKLLNITGEEKKKKDASRSSCGAEMLLKQLSGCGMKG